MKNLIKKRIEELKQEKDIMQRKLKLNKDDCERSDYFSEEMYWRGRCIMELKWVLKNLPNELQSVSNNENTQEKCERCRKLEFMIDNGLGWEDMINDI